MDIKSFFGRLFGKVSGNPVQSASMESPKTESKEGTRLVCADCKSTFLFEAGEQKFFKIRGLTPPKRCPTCRSKRKQRR